MAAGARQVVGRGQKDPGVKLQVALLEVWSSSASLWLETQRGKIAQILGGTSEIQGYTCVFRCGGEVGTMSAYSYGHHWHNWGLS